MSDSEFYAVAKVHGAFDSELGRADLDHVNLAVSVEVSDNGIMTAVVVRRFIGGQVVGRASWAPSCWRSETFDPHELASECVRQVTSYAL